MKIDLDNKTSRVLAREYLNKIYNCSSEVEISYNVYKLIHTFDVVHTAQSLIKLTKPNLPAKTQKHILDAAMLHDIGRCYEFKNGKLQKIDHAEIGAELIKKYFPRMEIEQMTTLYHNKLPSEKDPPRIRPILNYVRDADMLANIRHETNHAGIWLNHLLWSVHANKIGEKIDLEIKKAVQNHTQVDAKKVKEKTFLNMLLGQLCWYYGLKTKAGLSLAKKERLFTRFKHTICQEIIPHLFTQKNTQKRLIREIETIFPDTLFNQ